MFQEKKQISIWIDKGKIIEKPRESIKPKKNANRLMIAYLFGNIGFSIIVYLLCGIFIGKKIDAYYNTQPAGVLSGITLGFIFSIINLVQIFKTFIKQT